MHQKALYISTTSQDARAPQKGAGRLETFSFGAKARDANEASKRLMPPLDLTAREQTFFHRAKIVEVSTTA